MHRIDIRILWLEHRFLTVWKWPWKRDVFTADAAFRKLSDCLTATKWELTTKRHQFPQFELTQGSLYIPSAARLEKVLWVLEEELKNLKIELESIHKPGFRLEDKSHRTPSFITQIKRRAVFIQEVLKRFADKRISPDHTLHPNHAIIQSSIKNMMDDLEKIEQITLFRSNHFTIMLTCRPNL